MLILIGEFILVTFINPTLPSSTQLLTQTVDPLFESQNPQSQNLQESIVSSQEAIVINSTNCVPDQIMITEPVSGQEISGEVTIKGTADIPNFGFYKYEYAISTGENWTTILAGRTPVNDGDLGIWDVTELAQGDYQLRLVVFDNINTEYPACTITIKIGD